VHAAHIGEAVSRALMEIQVAHEVPVIHEVLLLETRRRRGRAAWTRNGTGDGKRRRRRWQWRR